MSYITSIQCTLLNINTLLKKNINTLLKKKKTSSLSLIPINIQEKNIKISQSHNLPLLKI